MPRDRNEKFGGSANGGGVNPATTHCGLGFQYLFISQEKDSKAGRYLSLVVTKTLGWSFVPICTYYTAYLILAQPLQM